MRGWFYNKLLGVRQEAAPRARSQRKASSASAVADAEERAPVGSATLQERAMIVPEATASPAPIGLTRGPGRGVLRPKPEVYT